MRDGRRSGPDMRQAVRINMAEWGGGVRDRLSATRT